MIFPASNRQEWLSPSKFSAAFYFILKVFCCWSKYFALIHPRIALPLLLLCESLSCLLPVQWNEISLAFEVAIFRVAYSELQNADCSEIEEREAVRANRKSPSLPDVCRLLTELCLDQFTASFVVFTKVGCGPFAASGAALAILFLPTVLQLAPKSRIRIQEFSRSKCNKESM